MIRRTRGIWLLLMAVAIIAAATTSATPARAAGCYLNGSKCYSGAECCSQRCWSEGGDSGVCVEDNGGGPPN